jgi:hypothetical protein
MNGDDDLDACIVCGNHAVVARRVDGDIVRECEYCGHIEGPPHVVELLELQNEADGLGVSIDSYPLVQFIERMPGVRVLGDSGGDRKRGALPFVAFELSNHRTWQLENIGQSLRLMRGELELDWTIEFTFEFHLGFELRPRVSGPQTTAHVESARRDLNRIWRRLQTYSALAWWRHE